MRATIALGLILAAVAAGCGITSSTSQPLQPAPTRAPAERPTQVLDVGGSVGQSLTLQIFDRSLAIEKARAATPAELADIEPLPLNAVGIYQTTVGDVLLTWTGTSCPSRADMFVSEAANEIVVVPTLDACQGEPSLRGVYLQFNPTVDAKRVSFRLAEATSG